MSRETAWKATGAALLVVAAGAGAAFAQSGIATAPDPARTTVTPPAAAYEANVSGPSTTTVKTGKTTHAKRTHRAASGAAASQAAR